MAKGRKPQILGPIDDKIAEKLMKALFSGSSNKKAQSKRIIGNLRGRGSINLETGEIITKSAAKSRRSPKYTKGYPAESAIARNKSQQWAKKRKAASSAAKKRADEDRINAANAQRQADIDRIGSGQYRTVNMGQLGEAAGRKGSKISKGREVPLTPAQARKAEREGRLARSQRKKSNATLRNEQNGFRAKIDNATSVAKKRQYRNELKAHIALHGEFK